MRRICVALSFFALICATSLRAQTITTVAGGGPNNLPAVSVGLWNPRSVAFDANGNYYIAAAQQRRIFKVDPSGTLTVFAGNGGPGFTGDGGPATAANLSQPYGVAVDGGGNVYIADTASNRIRKVDTTGTISTVAGNGSFCPPNGPNACGDGGPATYASLANPMGVAVSWDGLLLFIADTGSNRIRMVYMGQINTVAGVGSPLCPTGPPCGPGGPRDFSLAQPQSVALFRDSPFIAIADTGHNRIVAVPLNPAPLTIFDMFSVAGNGIPGYSGDGGPSTEASLNRPAGVAWDQVSGNLYIADSGNNRIRTFPFLVGTITTVAGNGAYAFAGDGGPATAASLGSPMAVVADMAGNIYIADTATTRIRRVDTAGTITTVAGNGTPAFAGDGGPATNASFALIPDVAVDQAGNIYISDRDNSCVRKLEAATGIVTTVAGNALAPGYGGDGGPAIEASFGSPAHVALDSAGNLYVADAGNNTVRRVDAATGTISTVAGNASFCPVLCGPDYCGGPGCCRPPCYSGDGGPATNATLTVPSGVALDGAGNVYISVQEDNRILKVDTAGTIITVAGNGSRGYSGDGGPATQASLNGPHDVAVDGAGNIYISDRLNNRIRMVDAASGVITTMAGNGIPGYSGDGGPATSASLALTEGLRLDRAGNLYIADGGNHCIRKVNLATGTITTVAGNGTLGFSGDGGPATNASLDWASGVAVDKAGGLLIADSWNYRVRRVGNTPTGNNVAVPPVDSTTGTTPVTLTFSSVTQAGNISLTTSSAGPALPPGFKLGSPPTYYDLTTSAVYAGSINICINYSGVSYSNPDELSIWHYDTTSSDWTELVTSPGTEPNTVCASTPSLSPFAILEPMAVSLFLHGSGGTANPPSLFLDGAAPTTTTAKYTDSTSIKFSAGNAWRQVGAWPAAPALTSGTLTSFSELHTWLGLKNSDDQGTRFDLRVEVRKNGVPIASGETHCIQGVTRNPSLAKEVAVPFASFSGGPFDGARDVLSLAIFTRIGTDASGNFCGGHSNAVGLRLYFDAVSLPSGFGVRF